MIYYEIIFKLQYIIGGRVSNEKKKIKIKIQLITILFPLIYVYV